MFSTQIKYENNFPVKTPVGLNKTQAPSDFSSKGLTGNRGKGVTILFNGFTWKHDLLMVGLIESLGFRCQNLPIPDIRSYQLGKELCNNGLCNPTYFMVGNLIKFLLDLESQGQSRKEIANQYTFLTASTCGPCRFGMYIEEYRLALRNAGFPDFRIAVIDTEQGVNQKNGGNEVIDLSPDLILGLVNSVYLGDVITSIAHKIRPFEVHPGETDRVLNDCMEFLYRFVKSKGSFKLNGIPGFLTRRFPRFYEGLDYLSKFVHQLIDKRAVRALEYCRDRFNSIKVDRIRVKPLVKVTGEFWAQMTEGDGNFRMFSFLEKEGAQILVEPISTMSSYFIFLAEQRASLARCIQGLSTDSTLKNLKRRIRQQFQSLFTKGKMKLTQKIFIREYRRLAKVFGNLSTYLTDQYELARLGGPYYNTFAVAGEGHMEIAKAIHYTTRNLAHMVLSLKPFGCLPSTQSDGVMSSVVSKYKGMIFLPVETSGEGEVNAQSRVQMALEEARHKSRTEFDQTLEKTGYTLEQIRGYVAKHPELETVMYPVPHYSDVVGTAANFIRHVSERMKKSGVEGG